MNGCGIVELAVRQVAPPALFICKVWTLNSKKYLCVGRDYPCLVRGVCRNDNWDFSWLTCLVFLSSGNVWECISWVMFRDFVEGKITVKYFISVV